MTPVPDSEYTINIPLTEALDSEYAAPTIWQEGAGKAVREGNSVQRPAQRFSSGWKQIEQSQYIETRVELSKGR
jgi:hypothetical protein